jgi:hypothetical protein
MVGACCVADCARVMCRGVPSKALIVKWFCHVVVEWSRSLPEGQAISSASNHLSFKKSDIIY